MTNKKKKRKLNGKFFALLLTLILIGLSIYKVPHFINVNKLLELGYNEKAIDAIYSKGLRKTILKNEYYSDYLNSEIVKDTFNEKYLKLYTLCDYLDDDYFKLYENLKDKKNYNDEELEKLFSKLKYYNLRPLFVFEKLDNETIDTYIEDCNNHPENNDKEFYVSNDYLKSYENYITVTDPSLEDVYVSTKSYIGEYEPLKLVEINNMHAVPGIRLESKALDAYTNMCLAIRQEDINMAIYAYSGYISYENQNNAYIDDNSNIKAGFSDSQTGLAVYVLASENPSANAFKDTKAYTWLLEHAHEYGFILRYPEGKEALTGHEAVYNYFRYVGIELANKIYESGLSFDEYYFEYLS